MQKLKKNGYYLVEIAKDKKNISLFGTIVMVGIFVSLQATAQYLPKHQAGISYESSKKRPDAPVSTSERVEGDASARAAQQRQMPFSSFEMQNWGTTDLNLTIRLLTCTENLQKYTDAIEHIACGVGKARILLKEEFALKREGESHTFRKVKNVPYAVTLPSVELQKGRYTLKPKIEKKEVEEEAIVHLSSVPVTIPHVTLSVHAIYRDFILAETQAKLNEKETFINPRPVPRERIMVDTAKIKIGETEVLGAKTWVSYPLGKTTSLPPEESRLWLEVKVEE